jgi:hypothetical protein
MMLGRRLLPTLSALAALSAAPGLTGCGGEDPESQAGFLKNTEKQGKPSSRWIYNGYLPQLSAPALVASLAGHTVRVEGYLPEDWEAPLPFYAIPSEDELGTRITVVYPIATGKKDPTTGKAPAGPGHYDGLLAIPFTPSTDVPWGGFPFMKYHKGRGLAFHGPITSVSNGDGTYEWDLRRGPVSHGCNRMQGEHVVEMAHLIGVDMQNAYPKVVYVDADVSVDIISDFDRVDGFLVDVDYPGSSGFVPPTGPEVAVYPTWSSLDFPRFVCAYDKTLPIDERHCDGAGENVLDPYTGAPIESESPDSP